MFKFYQDCTFESSSTFNWISFIALIISATSIVCTLYFIYLSKRVEILNSRFQKFCITSLDELFKSLDNQMNENELIKNIRSKITDALVEVQLFVTVLQSIYPNINTSELILDIEKFTEKIYNDDKSEMKLSTVKGDYYSMKLTIYSKLYDFALKKELSLLHRLHLRK